MCCVVVDSAVDGGPAWPLLSQLCFAASCWHFLLTGQTWPNSSPMHPICTAENSEGIQHRKNKPNPKQKLGKKGEKKHIWNGFSVRNGWRRNDPKRKQKKPKRNKNKRWENWCCNLKRRNGMSWRSWENVRGEKQKNVVCPSSLSFSFHIFKIFLYMRVFFWLYIFFIWYVFRRLYSKQSDAKTSGEQSLLRASRLYDFTRLHHWWRTDVTRYNRPLCPLLIVQHSPFVGHRSYPFDTIDNCDDCCFDEMFDFEWIPNDFWFGFLLMSDPNSSESNVGPAALLMHSKISRWKWKCCV